MENTKMKDEKQKQTNLTTYKNNYESCQKESDKLTAAFDRVSFLRGIIFVIAGLFLFIGFHQKKPILFLPVFVLGIIFLMLIFYHSKLEEKQASLKDSLSVLKEYLARFDDGWKSFPVDGARYLSNDFLEARDLDLFGKNSLYQYICTASTVWGQDQLARWLSLSGSDLKTDSALQIFHEVKSRQKAVAELAQKREVCMEFEVGARPLRNIEYDESRKLMDNF